MSGYRTIVIDPPWDTFAINVRGFRRKHYEAMSVADLLALPVADKAADDAHMYLWVTNPMLRDGRPFDLMEAWGFEYKTLLTWHKLGNIGLGWYFRGETEHVLFGIRGKAPIAPAVRERNHFAASKTVHSAKPDRFYELVERVSPGPYLEMFARRRRYGWDVWGSEAPEFAASQAEMGLMAP